MTEMTIEMAVEYSCQKCVDKTNQVLSQEAEVTGFKADLDKQSLVVTSSLPTSKLIDLIETKVDLLPFFSSSFHE